VTVNESARNRGASDSISVLRARGRRLCKLIGAGGTITDYDSARLYDFATVRVGQLDALAHLLRRLAHRPDCCVVRGDIADPRRTRGLRRLLHHDPVTGDAPTLRDVPRRWLALDIDGLSRPEALAPSDLAGCAGIVIDALPAVFRSARCIVQATASHGVKPGVRLRLWYWLARAVDSDELRRWLRGAPVDHAVFSAAQIIYTAAPLFADAAADPLPERLMLLPGTVDLVSVPAGATLEPPRRTMPAPSAQTIDDRGSSRSGFSALAAAMARVARAPEGLRHLTLLIEAGGLARLVARRILTEVAVTEALAGAAAMAGLPAAEATAAIAWALAHSRNSSP
jgi:hypothetical protein